MTDENICSGVLAALSEGKEVNADSVRKLCAKIEDQRKHLVRLEERNQELAKVLTNVLKDISFYQNYCGAEMFRTDFATASHMRQAMYFYKDQTLEKELYTKG